MSEVNGMKRVSVRVDADKIYVGCNRDEVLPAYLCYLFEYRGIESEGKDIQFNDCTCKLIKEGVSSKWG